jgi:hypothetical protein
MFMDFLFHSIYYKFSENFSSSLSSKLNHYLYFHYLLLKDIYVIFIFSFQQLFHFQFINYYLLITLDLKMLQFVYYYYL